MALTNDHANNHDNDDVDNNINNDCDLDKLNDDHDDVVVVINNNDDNNINTNTHLTGVQNEQTENSVCDNLENEQDIENFAEFNNNNNNTNHNNDNDHSENTTTNGSSGHISVSSRQQNDSKVVDMQDKQDVVRDQDESSSSSSGSIVCCNQLNSLTMTTTTTPTIAPVTTAATLLALKHEHKQCVDRQKNSSMSSLQSNASNNNSSKINVDCFTTTINDCTDNADNLLLLQKLSINNPFYRFRKQSTSLLALNTCFTSNSNRCLTFKLRKAKSESSTLKISRISNTPFNLNYQVLDNNVIITNPFSIFHDEAELALNVSTKRCLVKRPLQQNRSQHMSFGLNRFERQDFAQPSTQCASRKRAGQLLKKLALGKWPKATRTVGTSSHVDSQLKKLKISYPNHTQSWRRATPHEQSSYLSRLQAKTRQGLQRVREKCRTWRQSAAATRPQTCSSGAHALNPQLLDKEASFRYINDSAHISRYEAHCKQSLLYKSYKSEFELSKNLHYLDAYLQEHFEQNLGSNTGKSQSVGRISSRQRALMRQNMYVEGEQVKSESKALMYEANYTQSDSLPSDTLSSNEYASVFSGLHAKTVSIEGELQLKLEYDDSEDYEIAYKKKFETRARVRDKNRVDIIDSNSSLLAQNQNENEKNMPVSSNHYINRKMKTLQKQQKGMTKRECIENIQTFEECNKIKYESYLEHFQNQQQYVDDDSHIYNYNNKLIKFKDHQQQQQQSRKSCSEIENFYVDTFVVENSLTTENINTDKREVTKKLCYMHTGELQNTTVEHCQPITGDVDWVVSDTLRTYDADKGSFVLSNGNVSHKIEQQQQQQLNHQYGFYKQQEAQQKSVSKIKRKYNERFKNLKEQRQEVTLTPYLSAGGGRVGVGGVDVGNIFNSSSSSRRSKSSNSSGGSRHFDDEDEHYVNDDDDDDENIVGVNVEVDKDSDDDNTKRNSFVNVFYSGNGYNVDASAAITTCNNTLATTTTTAANKYTHSSKLSSTMTNSGRFNHLTDHTRFNEFYKRPLTNTYTGTGTANAIIGGGGGSSLNSSTLSTTSSSSSTISQQQQQPNYHQLKYFTPTYAQTKHATKYAHQSQQREKATSSTIIGNYADNRYTPLSGDYFERFLTHENTIPTSATTTTTTKTKENSPAFITALNYYGTGAAVDSLYAHSAYAHQQQQQQQQQREQQTTIINKIEGNKYKYTSVETTATTTTTSGLLQKRYQLMPNNTITNNSAHASTSKSRPQGAGYILEYEC